PRAEQQQQPKHPHQRRIQVAVFRHASANSCDFPVIDRPHNSPPPVSIRISRVSLRLRRWLFRPAVVAKVRPIRDVSLAVWADHSFAPASSVALLSITGYGVPARNVSLIRSLHLPSNL